MAWPLGVAGLVAILALGGWAADSLWSLGPGGEIAYRQDNLAGNAAFERGDYAAANDDYGRMIALRPRRVAGYLLRGISEEKEGLYTASVRDDTAALALAGGPMMRGDLLYNRGVARKNRGDLTAAVADLTAAHVQYALVRDPQLLPYVSDRQEDVSRERAEAYWLHKDFASAIADSSATMAFGHPRPSDYGVRGKAEAALGRDAAASADFGAALRLDPSYMIGYFGLGNIANKAHRYGEATAIFERATGAEPQNGQLWGSLGWFQYLTGQTMKAISSDRRSLALDPSQAWVQYNLALTYAAVGMGPQAQAAYANALAVGAEADRQSALKDIRTALARRPSAPILHQVLAQVEHGAGAPGAPLPPLPVRSAASAFPAPHAPAAYASALGSEVTMGGYGIQPPAGYTLTQRAVMTLSSVGSSYVWIGPARADGSAPVLQVIVTEDAGALASHETSRQAARDAVEDERENLTDASSSMTTDCSLNGLPFAREDWSGVGRVTSRKLQGSEYWMVSPSHIVRVTCYDSAPGNRRTMPLLRASIQTFRRILPARGPS